MNNKVNILEEINKMKNLIHTKAGTVISEQPTQTVDQFVTAFLNSTTGAMGTNLQSIKSILEKIPDKDTFIQFFNKVFERGKSFGRIINDELNPEEANQALLFAKIIKDRFNVDFDPGVENGVFKKKFKVLNWNMGSATNAETPAANLTNRQKNINFNYCSVKNGKIENTKSSSNGMTFNDFVSTYTVTASEIAEAKKTCPSVNVAAPAPAGPTPTQRFSTTATSLGIQNPKMDVSTLQTILNTLNQGGSGLTESKNLVKEELNKMKYILGYQRGKVISEQDAPAVTTPAATTAPASTPKDLITLIQTVLNDKFKQPLGPTGADGRWGKFSQDALENALKTIKSGSASKQATPGTEVGAEATTPTSNAAQGAVPTQLRYASSSLTTPAATTSSATPAAATTTDIYTTLLNNKTLQTRDNGNKIVYKGADLPIAQRQELESKLQGMGYRVSRENNDIKQGDKIVFKKN
jgi:hypothetical protein